MRDKIYNIVKVSLLILIFALLAFTFSASFVNYTSGSVTDAAGTDPTITIRPLYDQMVDIINRRCAYPKANVCYFEIECSKIPSETVVIYWRTVEETAISGDTADSQKVGDFTKMDSYVEFSKDIREDKLNKLKVTIEVPVNGNTDALGVQYNNSSAYLSRYFKVELYDSKGLINKIDKTTSNHYAYGMVNSAYTTTSHYYEWQTTDSPSKTVGTYVLDEYYSGSANSFSDQSAKAGGGMHALYSDTIEMNDKWSYASVNPSKLVELGLAHVYVSSSWSVDGETGDLWQNNCDVDLYYITKSGSKKRVTTWQVDGYFTYYNMDMRYFYYKAGRGGVDHDEIRWGSKTYNDQTNVMRLYSGVGPKNNIVATSMWHSGYQSGYYSYSYYQPFETFYRCDETPAQFAINADRGKHGSGDEIEHIKYFYAAVDDVQIHVENVFVEDATGKTKDDDLRIFVRLNEPCQITNKDGLYIIATNTQYINPRELTFNYVGGEYTDTLIFSCPCSDIAALNDGNGIELKELWPKSIHNGSNIRDLSNPNQTIGTCERQDGWNLTGCSKQGFCDLTTDSAGNTDFPKMSNCEYTTEANFYNTQYHLTDKASITFLEAGAGSRRVPLSVPINAYATTMSQINTSKQGDIAKTHSATVRLENPISNAQVFYAWSENVKESTSYITRPTEYINEASRSSTTTGTSFSISSSAFDGTRFLFLKSVSPFGNTDEEVCGPFYFDNTADNVVDIIFPGGNDDAIAPSKNKLINFYIDYGDDLRTASPIIEINVHYTTQDVWDRDSEFGKPIKIWALNLPVAARCTMTESTTKNLKDFQFGHVNIKDNPDLSIGVEGFYKKDGEDYVYVEKVQRYSCSYTLTCDSFNLKDGEFLKAFIGIAVTDVAGNTKAMGDVDTAKVILNTNCYTLKEDTATATYQNINIYEDADDSTNVVATLTHFNKAYVQREVKKNSETYYYLVDVGGKIGRLYVDDIVNCNMAENQRYETSNLIRVFMDTRNTRGSITTFDGTNEYLIDPLIDSTINAFDVSGNKRAGLQIELVNGVNNTEHYEYQVTKKILSTKGIIQVEEYTDKFEKKSRDIIVANEPINIYQEANSTSLVLVTMAKKESAIIIPDTTQNTFYKVSYTSESGDVTEGYISIEDAARSYLTDAQLNNWFDISTSAKGDTVGYFRFVTKTNQADLPGMYTFQIMVYKRNITLKSIQQIETNIINIYKDDPTSYSPADLEDTTKMLGRIELDDKGVCKEYSILSENELYYYVYFDSDHNGYILKTDVASRGLVINGDVQYTIAFDVYYGTDTNNTVNVSKVERGIVYQNKVYSISSDTKFYYKDRAGSILTEGYGAKNIYGTSAPAVFSSSSVALNYLKYKEYQDLYVVRIENQIMANQFNDKSSTTYMIATKENHIAQVGEYWVRYKRSTWTDQGTIDSWCWYYYSNGLGEISIAALPQLLTEAINAVVENIMVAYGKEILLTSDGGLDEYGAPYINPLSVKAEPENVIESKTGTRYIEQLMYAGDNSIYSSTVTVDGRMYYLASTLKLDISSDTNFYYAPYDSSKLTQYFAYKKVVPKDGSILKEIIKSDSGLYKILEIDKYGSRSTIIYVDKSAPTLNFRYTKLDTNGRETTVEGQTDSSQLSYSYNAMTVTLLELVNDIDEYSYVAIYNKTTGKQISSYTASDLKKEGGVTIANGIFYVEVYDRSGNNYRIDFRLNSALMQYSIVDVPNTSITLNVTNRTSDDIYRYEITYNNKLILGSFQSKATYVEAGLYEFYVEDWYGNIIDETYNFVREIPTVDWAYSTDSVGSGFVKFESNEKSEKMKITKSGSQTFSVITATIPRLTYALADGISYEFIGETPEMSIVQLINVTITPKELVDWSVKVFYTRFPNVYAIYNVIIDNRQPTVGVSFDQSTYSLEEDTDVLSQLKSKNINTEGKVLDPTRIDFKELTRLPRSISSGTEISAKDINIVFHDNTGISKVTITLTSLDGSTTETLVDEKFKSKYEEDVEPKEGEEPLREYDQEANVYTYSRYGTYKIKVYDLLGNYSEFEFTNSNSFDIKYYVDDQEQELPYILDENGEKTDKWSFLANFSDSSDSNIRIIGNVLYEYYNASKGLTYVLNDNNVCYYVVGNISKEEIASGKYKAYKSIGWAFGTNDTEDGRDTDYIYLIFGEDREQTFRIVDGEGTLSYVNDKEDVESTSQVYNKIEFGNTSQMISLSRDSIIRYLIKDFNDASVSKYICVMLKNGALYFCHYETSLYEEEYEDADGHMIPVQEIMVGNVEDIDPILSMRDASKSVNTWYKLLELPQFETYLEGKYDAQGRFYLRIKSPSINDMIMVIECKVQFTGAVYEPSYYKTCLSSIETDIDIYHYIDSIDGKTKIDTSGYTALEYIYTNGVLYVDENCIDTYFVKSAKIGYSNVNQFTDYKYFFLQDGFSGYDTKTTFVPFAATDDGFYRIIIENVFGNIRTYNFIISNDCVITMSVRLTDGGEFLYSKGYSETIYSNYQVAIQVYNDNVEATVLKDGEPFEFESQRSKQYFEIVLSKQGSYVIRMVDEYGNIIVKTAIINYVDLDLDSDVLYGFNEKALRRTEGYTNQKISINADKAIEQNVKYIAIKKGDTLKVLYDIISEKKVPYDPSIFAECVGIDGTGVYDVIFRDINGNMLVRKVFYSAETTFSLKRQTRTSQFAEDYSLEKALNIGFWSNHILLFNSTAMTYTFTVDGGKTICPRQLNFTSNVSEGNIVYEIYYLDEYGYEYSFTAHLYRTSVPVAVKDNVVVQDINNAKYTRSNIELTFDSLATCTYEYQDGNIVYSYKLGDVIKKDGKYKFTVEDYAGNTASYTITKDTICEYKFTNGADGPTVDNGFIVGRGNVFFTALNDDKVTIKTVFLNGEVQEGYTSSVFTKDGKWEILLEDMVGNQSYYMFYVITYALKTLLYSAPKDYKISDVWFTSPEGSTVNYTALIEMDENGQTAFNFYEDGTYTMDIKSIVTGVTYSFTFSISTQPPQTSLNGCSNGEATINEVKINGTVKGDIIYVYKDGKLVETKEVLIDGETVTISDEGDYRIVIRNTAGNEVEYSFTKKHVANTAGSALLIVLFIVIAIGLFIGLIYRNRSRVDK